MSATVANIHRALLDKIQRWAASQTPAIAVKDSNLRDPMLQASEDECLQFKFNVGKQGQRRTGTIVMACGYEVHAWSKRAEERSDKKTDRHMVIGSLVEDMLQDLDLEVKDYVGNAPATTIGCLQTIDTTLHFRDKSNRIFGSSVDYSVELPSSMQAVVVVSALLIKGVS